MKVVRKCSVFKRIWVCTFQQEFSWVAYCQATVQEMFGDLLYKGLLIWLDDLLGYGTDEQELLILLEKGL